MHTTEASRVVKVEIAQQMKLIKMSKINFYAQFFRFFPFFVAVVFSCASLNHRME